MEGEGIKPRSIIWDRDRKFPDEFNRFWEPDVRCIRIPPKATKTNSFVETYIGKVKQKTLNHFICFNREIRRESTRSRFKLGAVYELKADCFL